MKYNIGDRVVLKEGLYDKRFTRIVTIKECKDWYYITEEFGDSDVFDDNWIEWLQEEEWKPKEGDLVLAQYAGNGWEELRFIMKSKSWRYLCWFKMNNDWSVSSVWVMYWDEIKQLNNGENDEKKERKLMLTDSEWAKLQKDNNL